MRAFARRIGFLLLTAALALGAASSNAQGPAPREFAWRAPVEVPAGASLARVELPGPALLRLRSRDARDVRVFNASGEAVAFAVMDPPRPAPTPAAARTAGYPALALFSPSATEGQPKGSVQVRIDEPAGRRSVWVQMDGSDPIPVGRKLDSALFATKDERQLLGGLDVQATLPANTPVRITVSSSADLAQWTALPVRGRLYRFEGEQGPVSMTLEFEHQPVKLEGRYLRLDWKGQQGVSVTGIMGIVASKAQPLARVRAELPPLQGTGPAAAELVTGFDTPIAALALTTSRSNALMPVRILGRNDASQPWRLLAQTVVYRLGTAGDEVTNPPVALHGASAARLRIESTNGSELASAQLQANVEFDPVRLVFAATGAGPFELAAGRASTERAALPLAAIASALGERKVEDLPAATLGTPHVREKTQEGTWARLWPGAEISGKTTALWAVLLAGVLLLAGVAWTLLRQLKRTGPPEAAE